MSIEKNSNNKIGSGFSNYNTTVNEVVTSASYDVTGKTLTLNKFNGSGFTIPIEYKTTITGLTYSQIKDLKNNNQLLAGKYYELEYQTIHTIPNTTINHTGSTENLLLLALSNNSFDKKVYSKQYPDDIILYDFDDNLTEDGLVSRNGRIIYRKFLKNNVETHYDFREVTYRIWDINSSAIPLHQTNYQYSGESIFNLGGNYYMSIFPHYNTSSPSSNGFYSIFPSLMSSFNSTGLTFSQTLFTADTSYTDYKTFPSTEFSVQNISIGKTKNVNYPIVIINGGTNNIRIDNTIGYKNIILGNGCSNITLKSETNNIIIKNGTNTIFIDNSSNIYLFNGTTKILLKNSQNIMLTNASIKNIYVNSNLVLSQTTNKNIHYDNYNVFSKNTDKNIINKSEYILQVNNSDANIVNEGCSYIYVGYGLRNTFGTNCKNIGFSINKNNLTYYGTFNGNTFLQNCNNINGYTLNNSRFAQNCENLSISDVNSLFITNTIKNKYFTGNTYNNVILGFYDDTTKIYNNNSTQINYKAYISKDSLGNIYAPYTDPSGNTLSFIKLPTI